MLEGAPQEWWDKLNMCIISWVLKRKSNVKNNSDSQEGHANGNNLPLKFISKSIQDTLCITGIQQKVKKKIYYQFFHYKACLQSSWWLSFPRKQFPSTCLSFYIHQNTCPANFTKIRVVRRSNEVWFIKML